jgi:hypothetical protein
MQEPSIPPTRHQRQKYKNYAVLFALLGFCAMVWMISIIKITS